MNLIFFDLLSHNSPSSIDGDLIYCFTLPRRMLSGKQTAFVNPLKSRIVAKLIDLLASDYPAPPDRHAAEIAAAYTKIYKYKCHLC